jgi:hypothetical protein
MILDPPKANKLPKIHGKHKLCNGQIHGPLTGAFAEHAHETELRTARKAVSNRKKENPLFILARPRASHGSSKNRDMNYILNQKMCFYSRCQTPPILAQKSPFLIDLWQTHLSNSSCFIPPRESQKGRWGLPQLS